MPDTPPPDPTQLAELRAEEALCAALLARLAEARAHGEPNLPAPDAPCFGHLRVRIGARTRDVFIGERRWPEARPPLLDWRSSPLAALYLTHQEGDEFELKLVDRAVQGEILLRRGWRFSAGELAGVDAPQASFTRGPGGRWLTSAEPAGTRLQPAPAGQPPRQGLLVPDALLDEGQRRVLETPVGTALLVEGPAGSGKTTACLRRTAQRCREGLDPTRALVLVPEAGLAALSQRALHALGARMILVRTFTAWLLDAARGLPDLPANACRATPARVRRFKRHPALLAALPAYVAATGDAAAERLDRALFARGALLRLWETGGPGTTIARLVYCERAWRCGQHGGAPARTATLFSQARRALRATAHHREALWQDRAFLAGVAARSGGDLGPGDVQAVLDHAWLQASQRSEDELWYVDPERLQTLDGQAIDDGTPREVAGTMDLEDLPVLLAIRLLELGPPRRRGGRQPTWDHLLVDEHQERAAVELFALGGVLAPGADLTLSGDRAQRVDKSGQAAAESDLGALLGRAAPTPVRLRLSHRATAEIGAVAHAVLGPLASGPAEPALHHGPPVTLSRYRGAGEAIAALMVTLDALRATGPRPEVAVIARDAAGARRLFAILDQATSVRLVLTGDFSFGRGEIQVTWVGQVGGMEFDTVVIPDADAWTYPEEDDARRHLYVALTRARRQLWLQAPGEPTDLLPPMAPGCTDPLTEPVARSLLFLDT